MGAINPERFNRRFVDQHIEVEREPKPKNPSPVGRGGRLKITRSFGAPTAWLWQRIDDDLRAAGYEPLPAPLETLTTERVKVHLGAVYGKILADELRGDPARLGYAKARSDQEIADLLNLRQVGAQWRPMKLLFRLASGTGPTLGPRLPLVPEVAEVAEDTRMPNLARFNDFDRTALRFFQHTVSEGFRNRRIRVQYWTDTTANLEIPLSAPMQPDDLVYIEVLRGRPGRPRRAELLRRLPYAPKQVTAEDIAQAKA